MAGSLPARLSAAQGRKFGLTVGLAFVVLSAIAWWRSAETARTVLLSLGAVLVLAGLLVPTYLGPVERAWMRMALLISKVTTPILMGVIYFVVITPVGLFRRAIGRNALVHRAGTPGAAAGGVWHERAPGQRRGDLARQY